MLGVSRQGEGEPGARAEGALGGELAAHVTRKVAADRQSESRAFLPRREPAVHLHERLENGLEAIGGNPYAAVRHGRDHPRVVRGTVQTDLATRRGELDGVR